MSFGIFVVENWVFIGFEDNNTMEDRLFVELNFDI